ncbi:MAG: glycosyltransferase family 4 protein [Pyrinomonadaceae bacterium]|nr:glycosyltransferase family 4 protein [Pyrinomonadaceae bacterium]
MANKQEKLKITIIAPSLRIIGGQSIQANRLFDALSEDFGVNFLPNNPETIFQNLKLLRTIFTSLKFWWLLLSKLPKTDIVHIFSSGTTSYLISTLPPLFIAKLFRKKTILNYHTGEAEEHLKNWKLTAKPTMKWFDKIVVPSKFLVDVFAKYGLHAEAIFNFVDTEKFKFRERKKLEPIFLSNRNFEPYYNVSCVIRAFAEIQKQFPEAKLLIAGFGSEEKKLKDLAAELKLENVDFLGKIPNEEMPQIYDSADSYLNASLVDNMPLSLIEAFSAGVPVISSNAGGIPYLIEHEKNGLLVKMNDCQALAVESIKLLNDSVLAKNIIGQAKLESEKYEWQKVKKDWVEFFLNCSTEKK